MDNFDWTRFELQIPIRVSPEAIFSCWNSSKGLLRWFLRKADFYSQDGRERKAEEVLETGDRYVWRWFGYSDEVTEEGEIQVLEYPKSLQFRFGNAGNCLLELEEKADFTLVHFTQFSIPAGEQARVNWHMGCKMGWTFYLTNLKSILEGGVDLRYKGTELSNLVNA